MSRSQGDGQGLADELLKGLRAQSVKGHRCPHCGKGSEDPILDRARELREAEASRLERNAQRKPNPRKEFWDKEPEKPRWAREIPRR